MIDITPSTGPKRELNAGMDQVRLAWKLDAQVDPHDLTFTAVGVLGGVIATYSGGDLTETEVQEGGQTYYKYSVIHDIEQTHEQYEYRLEDGVQSAGDTATLTATPNLTK